jgi:hypothetical protein
MLNVWAVPHEDLLAVVSTLYDSLDGSIVLKLLPKHGESKTFPYINSLIPNVSTCAIIPPLC